MKLYAPLYFKDFVCIADKCNHSCCIGWEIDIDKETLDKYKLLDHSYKNAIIQSIEFEETPHFKLAKNDRCPHLNGNGLCDMILNVGEDYLCEICREHPRFYNNGANHKEVGIGISCEAACRIILESDSYAVFVEQPEIDCDEWYASFDVRPCRERIYAILSDKAMSYNNKLRSIYQEFKISPSVLDDEAWRDVLSALEYLDESHKDMFSCYSSELVETAECEKMLERILAYFVFRHCTQVQDEDEFRISLGFCLFCERLLASLARSLNVVDINGMINIAVTVSEEIEYSEDNTESIMLEFSIV